MASLRLFSFVNIDTFLIANSFFKKEPNEKFVLIFLSLIFLFLNAKFGS